MNEVKKRKVKRSDWTKVEEFVKKELDRRKACQFRKAHEPIWREVDRQISMTPMQKLLPNGQQAPQGWESAFELGELSKASEVITADVMRLIFPANRTWFEAHCKPPMQTGENGRPVPVEPEKQKKADGIQRAVMTQQHMDFGLKARVELSVKEALHHGGFVATVEWEKQNKFHNGTGVESLEAPVWVPHSMWNSYPDPSPSIVPGAIYYPGSMMIVSFMPRHKVLALKGEGYMNLDTAKIPKRQNKNKDVDTDDIELVTYYGDLVIPREDGDIYLPNSKCITANGVIIFYNTNPLPFPEVIYQGYERQDLRDPYFTSPIIKNSPMAKMTTILANEFIDGVKRWSNPPGSYDAMDPTMVASGGPQLWPGAMTGRRGSSKVEFFQVGDPQTALMGVQFGLRKLEEGTSVNAIRQGAGESDRKTATEVQNTQQGSEVRTVDFVGKIEGGALRPFLYMQHDLNLKHLESYSFYCPEKGLPDFLTVKKDDLPKVVHYEVVGSKGILGEQRRSQQMTAVTAFAASTPGFAELLNHADILIGMYEDAGVKGSETYVKTGQQQVPPEVQAQMQQMQQALQETQAALQQAEQGNEAKMAEVQGAMQIAMQELAADQQRAAQEQDAAQRQAMMDAAFERWKANLDAATKVEVAQINAKATKEARESTARAVGSS